jgi:hypothetical protein
MTNDDEKLKDKIIFDIHPKLPENFSTKTLDSIFIKGNFSSANKDGTLKLVAFIRRHQFLLTGLLFVGAFALQQGHQKYVDDELLHIDTLSMSSFSVL